MKAAESRNWCSRWLGSKLIPNPGLVPDRRQRAAGGDEVVGDLGRVHLEREFDPLGLEDVDDRPPALREVVVAALDRVEVVRGERVEHVPGRRAREPGHHVHTEPGGGAGGVLHVVGGPLAHPLGISVAPDVRRHDRLVALVDRVADRLADEVVADRPDREAVALEDLAPARAVVVVGDRLGDVEVVPPASQLEPVEAPPAAFLGELLERQVGPLTGEQGDGTAHAASFVDRISSGTPALT